MNRRAITGIARQYASVWLGGHRDNLYSLVHLDSMRVHMRIDPAINHIMTRIPHRWTVTQSVILLEANGKKKIVSETMKTDAAFVFNDLIEEFADLHRDLANSIKTPERILTVGRICIPGSVNLTEERDYEIYNALGAWETTNA